MQTELRKLAAELRKQGEEVATKKMIKSAQVLRAATALRLMSKKIGG